MHAMRNTIRQLLLPAVVLAAFLPAAPAAASWQSILQDCVYNDGLTGSYTQSELQEAKRHVTGERLAYTECLAEISAAMNVANASGNDGRGGKGGRGSKADANGDGVVSPAEKRKALKKKRKQAKQIASINDTLTPDAIGSAGDDGSGGIGAPAILALVLLALAAIGGGTWYAARRNPAIAETLRRVPLPGRRG